MFLNHVKPGREVSSVKHLPRVGTIKYFNLKENDVSFITFPESFKTGVKGAKEIMQKHNNSLLKEINHLKQECFILGIK